mgnify:CR=1 FL=1
MPVLAPTLKPVFVTPCTALKTSAAFVALVFVDVKVPALPTLVMVWLPALIPAFINESVLRGELPNLYYLFQLRPYSNLQTFVKDGQIFIAKNIATSGSEGQIVLKIGEL